jgi:hypothetical protein
MAGDATLFARTDVVEAAWAIVDPVLHGAEPAPLYEPGSWGPKEADEPHRAGRGLEHTSLVARFARAGGSTPGPPSLHRR